MDRIREIYQDFQGKYPEIKSGIQLREEPSLEPGPGR